MKSLVYKENSIPAAGKSTTNRWLLYQGAEGMTWRACAHQQGAAIPQPDPTAWSYLLLIPVHPNLVWDGKTSTQFLFSQFLLQPRMTTFFSSGQWDMNCCPLERFWDRCHCPGPFSFFIPWKWSWRLDWQFFRRCFHPKPHSLLFMYRDFRASNCCVCGVTQLSPDDLPMFSSFLCVFISFPPCSDLSRTGVHTSA